MRVLFAACLFVALAAALASAQMLATVDLGEIRGEAPVSGSFLVANPSAAEAARVDVISVCPCLAVEPASFVLDPGATQRVRVTYTPEGYATTDNGLVLRSLLVRSSLPGLDDRRVSVFGTLPAPAGGSPANAGCDECRGLDQQRLADYELALRSASILSIDIYYDPGCSKCESYLGGELPAAARAAKVELRLLAHDVSRPAELTQLRARLGGEKLTAFPLAFIGAKAYQGLDAIRRGVAGALGR
jgi:hypothetical protein